MTNLTCFHGEVLVAALPFGILGASRKMYREKSIIISNHATSYTIEYVLSLHTLHLHDLRPGRCRRRRDKVDVISRLGTKGKDGLM